MRTRAGSFGLALALSACAAAPAPTPDAPRSARSALPTAQEEAGKRTSGEHHHHVALAVGAVSDTGARNGEGARFALEYEYTWAAASGRPESEWGIGGMLEFNTPPVEALLTAVQLVYHPVPQARLIVAPGWQFAPDGEDAALLRFGMAWEFELGERMSLAPELFYDFLSGGDRSSVLALAFGYAW